MCNLTIQQAKPTSLMHDFSSEQSIEHIYPDLMTWAKLDSAKRFVDVRRYRKFFEQRDRTLSESMVFLQFIPTVDKCIPSKKNEYEGFSNSIDAYDERIGYLKKEANLDGYDLNSNSLICFLEFLRKSSTTKTGDLTLLENGNLRAVWKNGATDRIGLQFMNRGILQYVIFMEQKDSTRVLRVYGRDTINAIMERISSMGLSHLLFE